jgi:hypothetical protein
MFNGIVLQIVLGILIAKLLAYVCRAITLTVGYRRQISLSRKLALALGEDITGKKAQKRIGYVA